MVFTAGRILPILGIYCWIEYMGMGGGKDINMCMVVLHITTNSCHINNKISMLNYLFE